jgi:hypothetical protein
MVLRAGYALRMWLEAFPSCSLKVLLEVFYSFTTKVKRQKNWWK